MPVAVEHGKPVLHIVDNDASVRDGLSRLALAAGFEAHAYPSVERFLECFASHRHACVLLDASLADCAKIRESTQGHGIACPVIMLTTGHGEIDRQRVRSVGARFLLHKPVDAQALFDAIAWVTDES